MNTNYSPLDSSQHFLQRISEIAEADYLILDKASHIQVTGAIPFYVEKFKELFGLSDKVNRKNLENALTHELETNQDLLTKKEHIALIQKIAKKFHLIPNNTKSFAEHEKLARLIQKITNKIQDDEFPSEKKETALKAQGQQMAWSDPQQEKIINAANFLYHSESKKDPINQEKEDEEETLNQDQAHQEERQQSLEKQTIQSLDAARVAPIVEKKVAPVKMKSKVKAVKISSSKKIDPAHPNKSPPISKNWDRISSITKMGVSLLAGAAVGMYLMRTHGANFSDIFLNQSPSLPNAQIQNSPLFHPICGLDFSANPALDFYSNFDLNQHHSYQPICINELTDKGKLINPNKLIIESGRTEIDKKEESLLSKHKADLKEDPSENKSEDPSFQTSTQGPKWSLLFASGTILTTFLVGLNHLYRRATTHMNISPPLEISSPQLINNLDQKSFSLKKKVKDKIDSIRILLSKNESGNLENEFSNDTFKIRLEKDVFEMMDLADKLIIKQDEKEYLTINGYSDWTDEQEELIGNLLQEVEAAIQRQESNLTSPIENVIKLTSPIENVIKLFPKTPPFISLPKDTSQIALEESEIDISSLEEGQNVLSEQLIAAIEKFQKVAPEPNQSNKEKIYLLTIKGIPLVDIVHRNDGSFYIQSHSIYVQYGTEGSRSISVKDKEVRIGNSITYTQEQLNAAYSVLYAISTKDKQMIEKAFLLLAAASATRFDNIHSAKLVDIPISYDFQNDVFESCMPRDLYKEFYEKNPGKVPSGCVISTSNWFPKNRVAQEDGSTISFSEHLMKKKKELAVQRKWEDSRLISVKKGEPQVMVFDEITNMEAALHSFFVPMNGGETAVDALWFGGAIGVKMSSLGEGKGRPYILSTSIQPDMEFSGDKAVMLTLCELGKEEINGKELDVEYIFPTRKQKQDAGLRNEHDLHLLRHMIFHLYSKRIKPKKKDVELVTLEFLNQLITNGSSDALIDKAILVNNKTISLDAMFNFYKEQLSCELLALESQCPQGYIFTIDPPSLFIDQLGRAENAHFLNRLQALAMRDLLIEGKIKNMNAIAFSDFADSHIIGLYQVIGEKYKIKVYPKVSKPEKDDGLFDQNGKCLIDPQSLCVIVIHNNSDGFGYNLENEKPYSLDGLLGSTSNFCYAYKNTREDLTRHVFTQADWLRLRELRNSKNSTEQTENDSRQFNGIDSENKSGLQEQNHDGKMLSLMWEID